MSTYTAKHPDEDAAAETIWNVVLGIDPGHVNCGVALVVAIGSPVRYEVHYIGNLPLDVASAKKQRPMSDIVQSVWKSLQEVLSINVPHSAIVESQYGYRQACIAHAVQGILIGNNIPVTMAAPVTLNKRLERLIAAMEVKMDTTPEFKTVRTRSKWRHVNFLEKVVPDLVDQFPANAKRDDMADALIYALYECLGGDKALSVL